MSSPIILTRSVPSRGINMKIFDRRLKALHRGSSVSFSSDLHKFCAEQMLDRRSFVKRETPVVLEVGAHTGWYFRHMLEKKQFYGLKQYIQTDISEERLNRNYEEVKHLVPPDVEYVQICCDEESSENQPFGIPDKSVDMAVSCLSMHWVNDLESAMVNVRKVLKKDGFFLNAMFGGNTLYELRSSFSMAQAEVLGGVSPHVSPMIDGAGLSTLVLQAGFNLPTIDLDRHLLLYQSPFHLMEHLSCMGESACLLHQSPLNRDVLLGACACYDVMYKKNELTPATFEIFHMIAWSPSPTQPKPLARGSGQVPLSTWNSNTRKRLQSVLDEYAQNPDDEKVQNAATELFNQLREESGEIMEKKGVEMPASGSHRSSTPLSKNEKPFPPFQQ